jgi:dihydropteroate synthase
MTDGHGAGRPAPCCARTPAGAANGVLPPTTWAGGTFAWGERTFVMAIVNATPDSFSGDGLAGDPAAAAATAARAVADGADLIDVGAESTRPGHTPLGADEEIARLLPVLRAVRAAVAVPISVDTSKAAVAAAALDAGASLVNDVRGLSADPDLAALVAARAVPAVVMHDLPPDGQGDLVTAVVRELSRRLDRAVAAGIAWERLIVDPGFGFGKDWRQNLELLRRLGELRVLGRPILVGTSRKGTIGRVLGLPEQERVEGTAATVALAIANGADMVRVHDVRAQARVARMTDAVVRGAPAEARTWAGGPPV